MENKKLSLSLISDTHNRHNKITDLLKGGDIIIHSGDFTSMGYKHECEDFLKWFIRLPYRYKIFICGNHELGVEEDPNMLLELIDKHQSLIENDLIYLNEQSIQVEGLDIFGSAYTPFFHNWAFNVERGEEIAKHWAKIPYDTDILVTHGPVYGINDKVLGGFENLGCKDLRDKVFEVSPLIHQCGHIHSGQGYKEVGKTNFFNASILDERYNVAYKPWNIEIEQTEGKWTINDINND